MSEKIMPADKISEELEKSAKKITPKELDKDINKIISSEKKIASKTEILKSLKFSVLYNQVKLAYEMITDYRSRSYKDLPWKTITLLTVAFLYFINPFDFIPDFLPVLGYGDDALAFAGVFKAIQSDLKKYCSWKGYDPAKYF